MTVHPVALVRPTSPDLAEHLHTAHTMAGIAETLLNRLKVDGDRVMMNTHDREQIAFAVASVLDAIEAAR
jgi:hypothetical protein